jgi:hypothetical protein
MTFYVHFYAEQAFLSQTKALLENTQSDKEPEVAAMCILACTSAVEAFSNSLLIKAVKFRHFDELKLTSKIEQILLHGGTTPDWGIEPWQTIAHLIKIRNWLAHYKENNLGLVNGDFEWLSDGYNKIPKIDPFVELNLIQARKYYDRVRNALIILAQNAGAREFEFDFLLTEQYQPLLVG